MILLHTYVDKYLTKISRMVHYVNMRGHYNLVPRPPVVDGENWRRKLVSCPDYWSWNETGWNDQQTKLSKCMKWYLLVHSLVVVVNNKENGW